MYIIYVNSNEYHNSVLTELSVIFVHIYFKLLLTWIENIVLKYMMQLL